MINNGLILFVGSMSGIERLRRRLDCMEEKGKNEDCVGSIGGIICGVQLIPLIGSILPTEIALKKNFDKNGTRR